MKSSDDIPTDTTPPDSIEVAHWWDADSSSSEFSPVVDGFRERHPDYRIEETATGDLRIDVKCRILREDPPDIWIEWPGANLHPYVDADVVGDISEIWTGTDMEASYLDAPIDAARFDGTYYAVPLNIPRINLLYVDVDAATSVDASPDALDSPSAFVEVLERVSETDVPVGMIQPMRDPWTVLQLFELVLLGEYGADVYGSILEGEAVRHQERITHALELTDAITAFATDDAQYLDHTAASDRFHQESIPFFQQGSWSASTYTDADAYTYGSEWDAIPFPGTDGLFLHNMNAVLASPDAVEEDPVRRFLEYVGSRDALARFNQGSSIPPRTDVRTSQFGPFLRDQITAFERAERHTRSITHGLGCRPQQLIDLKAATAELMMGAPTRDVSDRFVSILGRTTV